jgi:hypothetical protein
VATACAVVFHVGPACFAARYGPLGPRASWALVPLAVGYIVYSARLLLAMHRQLPFPRHRSSQITLFVLLLLVATLAFVRCWWKAGTVVALLIGVGLSFYMLATPWNGIWTANSHFAQEPFPDSGYLTEGLFVAIAPAVAIAWHIGSSLETRKNRIWLTASFGIFLPLLLSAFVAALMAQAGENLFWRPSLFLGFEWALEGRNGGHNGPVWNAVAVLVALSLIGPALLSALSVRLLASTFGKAQKLTLALFGALVIAWLQVNQPDLWFHPPYDLALSLWTFVLGILGLAGGLACLFRRSSVVS